MVQASNATTTGAGPEQRTKNSVMSTTLIGAHGLEHMYGHSFPVLVTALYENLGLDPVQAGLLSAVRQLSSGATSMASGFFVDMFQHRSAQLLAFSMALLGIGYLLVALSPTYSLILAALVIASAGSALWHPPALGLLSQRFPERRGLFISLHRSSGNVGDMIGPLIAGGLLAWLAFSDSWRWILGGGTPMLFVLALLILAILWNVAGPRKEQAQDFKTNFMTQLVSLRGAFRGVGMWAIFTVSAVRGMADRSVVFFLPFYLRDELEMSYVLVGAHVMLIALPGILSGPLFGALSDRIGRKSIIAFVMAVTFLLPLALVWAGSTATGPVSWGDLTALLTLLVIAVFGLFHSVVNSLTQAAAIDEAAGRGLDATFIGLMWGSNAFFGAGIALVAGFLVDAYGWVAAFYFASALFFVGFLASLLMPRPSLPRMQAAA